MLYRGRTFPLYSSSRTFPLAGLILTGSYTVADAINYAKPMVANMPTSQVQIAAADFINSIIWNAYPWRWAKVPMTPILLVDGQQDYAFGPTDYMRMCAARLTRTDVTPDQASSLSLVRNLEPDLTPGSFRGRLSLITYDQAHGVLRLNAASYVPPDQTIYIDGEYQFQPVALISAESLFPFPNQYFHVFCAGLLWQFFMLAKDERAGTSQATKGGNAAYTGQMGIFFDALMSMREAEDWGAGDITFPSDPLGQARNILYSPVYGA